MTDRYSGASVNVVGSKNFISIMQNKAKLQPGKTTLKLYDGTIIIPLAQCKLKAEYQGKACRLNYHLLQHRSQFR